MNWMTSGRHRALRSKRGKKRSETSFPAHVQREVARVRRHPLAHSTPAHVSGDRGDAPAWYIRPIMDANESHDIQMLELAREVATETLSSVSVTPIKVALSPPSKTSVATATTDAVTADHKDEKTVQERRCVFTPVKGNRSRARAVAQRPVKKAASPQPRDLLLFNEGEQVSKQPIPVAPESSRTAEPILQEKYSVASHSRWATDPRGDHDLGTQVRWESRTVAPFYASSSSSTDEDTDSPWTSSRRPDSADAGRQARLSTTGAEAPKRDHRFVSRKRSNMFEELNRAMNPITRTLRQDDSSAHGTSRVINFGGGAFASSFQSSENQQRSTRVDDCNAHEIPSEMNDFAAQEAPPKVNGAIAQGMLPPDPSLHDIQDPAYRQSQIASGRAARISTHDRSRHESEGGRCERGRSPTGHFEIFDESRDSTSSQGSYVLPPPVNWQKELKSRRQESSLGEAAEGLSVGIGQDQPYASNTRVDDSMHSPFCASTRIEGSGSNQVSGLLSNVWRSTPRTRAIFAMVECAKSTQTQEKTAHDEIFVLQRSLRENESMLGYVHTLLQCHRIDETLKSNSSRETH